MLKASPKPRPKPILRASISLSNVDKSSSIYSAKHLPPKLGYDYNHLSHHGDQNYHSNQRRSRVFSTVRLTNQRRQAQSFSTGPLLSMDKSASMDPAIPRILSFWFPPTHDPLRWFTPSPPLDQEIRSQFSHLIQEARTTPSSLDNWTSTPHGTLALLLLLDQFPRNIYRGSGAAFASDAKAVDVAVGGIARGFDREVGDVGRAGGVGVAQAFFYLPLVHSETLLGQVAGLACYEGFLARCGSSSGDGGSGGGEGAEGVSGGKNEDAKNFATMGVDACKKHRDVIMRFGRFPARNEALGRESTEEERKFLKENPMGF